ncbi:hypothetical protein D3C76_1510050 [compost metagenome]
MAVVGKETCLILVPFTYMVMVIFELWEAEYLKVEVYEAVLGTLTSNLRESPACSKPAINPLPSNHK